MKRATVHVVVCWKSLTISKITPPIDVVVESSSCWKSALSVIFTSRKELASTPKNDVVYVTKERKNKMLT